MERQTPLDVAGPMTTLGTSPCLQLPLSLWSGVGSIWLVVTPCSLVPQLGRRALGGEGPMPPKSLKPCSQTCLPSEKAGVCDLKTFPQNLTFSPVSPLLTMWPQASLQPLWASSLPSVKRGGMNGLPGSVLLKEGRLVSTVPPGKQPCWYLGGRVGSGTAEGAPRASQRCCMLHIQASFRIKHPTRHLFSLYAATSGFHPPQASPLLLPQGTDHSGGAAGCSCRPWKRSLSRKPF